MSEILTAEELVELIYMHGYVHAEKNKEYAPKSSEYYQRMITAIERLRSEVAELKAERDRLRNGLIQVSAWLEGDTDAVARDYCINANHIYESTAHAQEIILTALDGKESKS